MGFLGDSLWFHRDVDVTFNLLKDINYLTFHPNLLFMSAKIYSGDI